VTDPENLVVVQVVSDELEADETVRYLGVEGIEASYRPTEVGESLDGLASGWTSQAILVAPEHAERARELLGPGLGEEQDAEPS
jgi:hypothetical protein